MRRTVVARIDEGLKPVLQGRIVIDHIGDLGPCRTTWATWTSTWTTPRAPPSCERRSVSGRIATTDLLASLVRGKLVIVSLSDTSAASVDVSLDADETGALRLARAFTPVPSTAPPSPPDPEGGIRLSIPGTKLAHVVLHGRPGGAPPLDVDVDALEAAVHVTPRQVVVDLARAQVVARSLVPGAPDAAARGTITARLQAPIVERDRCRGAGPTWQGTVGNVPETLEATYDGGMVVASADVPATAPADLATLWPACPFTQPTFAHVEVVGALPALEVRVLAGVGPSQAWVAGPVSLGDEVRANLRFVATALDARALSAVAPETKLSASGAALFIQTADGAAQASRRPRRTGGRGSPPSAMPSVAVRAHADRTVGPRPERSRPPRRSP